ncbi:hypothetical protein L6452_01252 [Arctium lappa]|uniref:Uncharacterized protein n=1 Tax=Arctium lappa TaxID=4217 RepID=A0ACB9FG68_ARCLA|nr:hypothetical protein L6452_01252 [Arctium lappa]
MIRLPGGRKRSERLIKKNSFSNYMNTADNPLDEDGINAIGLKVELRQTQTLPVALDGKGDMKKSLHSIKRSDESDDDFMSIPKPVTSSSTIILDSDKPVRRKITKRIVEGMKGITLNEVLKERIDATRGRLRNRDTKAKDKMKRSNESVLDAGIEEGGSATLLERKQEEANNKDEFTLLHGDSFEKGRDDLEHERDADMKLMDDKLGHIVAAKYDIEMLLDSLIEKYHGDETFKKYTVILGDIFKYEAKDGGREMMIAGRNEAFPEIDIQQTPISQFWYSQTLFRVCDETALKSLSNKKTRVEIHETPAPNFDKGYSPIENVQPISVVKATRMDKGKEICIEAEPPLKKCKILGSKNNDERASRRTISLGDHLRSPYVRRAVNMKVTTEEKRIHD